MPYQKFTMIEDLPQLDQVSEKQDTDPNAERVQRFLRNKHPIGNIPEESGMAEPRYQPTYKENILMEPMQQHPQICSISCKDVYEHIETCPICKRFYKNDNTVYLIVIGILIILCILLIKKILSV